MQAKGIALGLHVSSRLDLRCCRCAPIPFWVFWVYNAPILTELFAMCTVYPLRKIQC